jgi:thymidylate kinase
LQWLISVWSNCQAPLNYAFRGLVLTDRATTFVAVTGAQGVGKSTFCNALRDALAEQGYRVTLLAGLGAALSAQGFVMGKKADERAVAAVVREHLRREREAPEGIVILDRCLIDMLAYVRTLGVTPPPLSDVYDELVKALAPRLNIVVLLEKSETFKMSSAQHEDVVFRDKIDREIQTVLSELSLHVLSLDAADSNSLERAIIAVSAINDVSPLEQN